jgi:hypothetical protein
MRAHPKKIFFYIFAIISCEIHSVNFKWLLLTDKLFYTDYKQPIHVFKQAALSSFQGRASTGRRSVFRALQKFLKYF